MNIKKLVVKLLKEYVIQEKMKDDFQLMPSSREEAEQFVMKHYLESWPTGIKRIYGIYQNTQNGKIMVGVIIYGIPFMTAAKFLEPEVKLNETMELKRLFILDEVNTKNIESFSIAQSIKLLKIDEPQVKVIITFADDKQGHKGVIYQATNATYLGSYAGKHKYIYVINGDINTIKNKIESLKKPYPKGIGEKSINEANKYNQYLQQKEYEKKQKELEKIKSELSPEWYDEYYDTKGERFLTPSTQKDDIYKGTEPTQTSKPPIVTGSHETEWISAQNKDVENLRNKLLYRQALQKAGKLKLDKNGFPINTDLWTDIEWEKWDKNIGI